MAKNRLRFLITAGPTQEPIDAVRFITNASSGKMGAALAEKALERGYRVTLVCGPVGIPMPTKANVIEARTADDMIDACVRALKHRMFDVFVCAAAISDYTPVKALEEVKLKSDRKELVLRLTRTRKLTALVKKRFPCVFVVGFKAEYGVSKRELVGRAFSKLRSEGLDLIVANDIGGNRFGLDYNEVFVIDSSGVLCHVRKTRKIMVADKILDAIEACIRT